MNRLLHGTAINLLFKVVGVLVGFVLTVITARLGTAERGEFSIFILISQIYITVFAGLGAAIAYRISRKGDEPKNLVSSSLIFSILAGTIFSIVCVIAATYVSIPPYDNLWLISIVSPILLFLPYLNGVYLGTGDMLRLNINGVSSSVIFLTVLLIMILSGVNLNLMYVLYVWCISQISASIMALFIYARSYKFVKPEINILKPLVSFSKNIGITNLVGLLNYRADLFLVQAFLGLSSAGIYSISVSISEMLWFISSSVTTAAYSRIGKEEEGNSAALVVRIVHINIALLLIATPFLVTVVIIALPLVFGEAYNDAIIPLLILLPGVLLYGSASTISAYYTNQLGKPELPKNIAIISLVTNMLGTLALIPVFGIIGAALSSCVAYILSIIVSYYLFIKYSSVTWKKLLIPDTEELWSDLTKMLLIFRRA